MTLTAPDSAALPERMRTILFTVVEEHIETAQPVSSRSTAGRSSLELSSASVRSLMGELTERGLLQQPHVSAGRVPTAPAYRLYVDALLESPRRDIGDIDPRAGAGYGPLDPPGGPEDFMRQATELLTRATGQVGFCMGRPAEEMVLERIHFARVSSERVMALLVSHGRVIQTRLIDEADSDTRTLERIGAKLSELAAGLSLADARQRLGAAIESDRQLSDRLQRKVIVLGWESLGRSTEAELYVGDKNRLLANPEFADVERLREVLTALEEKQRMLRLLDKVLSARTGVVIGDELDDPGVRECALVGAPLGHSPETGGLGVIGPVRMDYDLVIAAVRYVSERMNRYFC